MSNTTFKKGSKEEFGEKSVKKDFLSRFNEREKKILPEIWRIYGRPFFPLIRRHNWQRTPNWKQKHVEQSVMKKALPPNDFHWALLIPLEVLEAVIITVNI